MSTPQIIRMPCGEDADDAAIYDARKAELTASGVVLSPKVSAAMLRGDSQLRAMRRSRDKTQGHLEAETGIGQGYLSDLENGRRAGTPETLSKLARALDVPVDWVA